MYSLVALAGVKIFVRSVFAIHFSLVSSPLGCDFAAAHFTLLRWSKFEWCHTQLVDWMG